MSFAHGKRAQGVMGVRRRPVILSTESSALRRSEKKKKKSRSFEGSIALDRGEGSEASKREGLSV